MRILWIVRRLRLWTNQSLQRRLVFWSIGFWVVTVSILSLTFLLFGRSEILNETRQRNVQIASVVSRDVNFQVSSIYSDIRIFSRYLESLDPGIESQAAAILALRLSSPQRYRAIFYFDSEEHMLFHLTDNPESILALKTGDIISRPQVKPDEEVLAAYRMTNGAVTSTSDVHFTGIDRIPVVCVGVPLKFSEGRVRVVILQIDLRDIWQRINLSTVGKSGFTFAVSRNGVVIAHPAPAYIGSQMPSEITSLLAGYEGFTEYDEPIKQRAVFAAYSPVGGPTGWGIVVQQDASEVQAPTLRTGIFIMIVWLILATAGTVGILIMTRSFTRPIMELTKTVQEIAQTGKLTKPSTEQRRDEVGQLSQSFNQMIERLQTTEGRLATAAAEERNRLARDLHDAVSQTLFSASLIAEVLPRLWQRNPEEGSRRLEEVRQLTRGALAEMRTLLLELRPSALVEAELPHLLNQLGESINGRARVPVTVLVDGQCSFPTEVKVALYRIAQEALNNVAKHAGARQVKVNLLCELTKVTLKITDDGHGFDMTGVPPGSFGLGIMHERAGDIGALISVQSKMGHGTEVVVVWQNGAKESKL